MSRRSATLRGGLARARYGRWGARSVVCLLSLMVIVSSAAAQVVPDTLEIDALDQLLDDAGEDAEGLTEIVERLAFLAENPLDVNTATPSELSALPWIGPVLASAITAFRRDQAPFLDVSDVLAVPGMTDEILRQSRPFLTIRPDAATETGQPSRYPAVPSLAEMASDLRFEAIQRLTRRLDAGRGYEPDTTRPTYLGTPERIYTRLRARSGRYLSINLTLEKDPGERFEWAPDRATYGYDYASAHLALQDLGRVRQLVIGDYAATFGQGVALWTTSAFGKGSEPVRPLVRSSPGLRPYGSTDENRFLRGVALSLAVTPRLAVSGFVSRRSLDASFAGAAHDTTDAGDGFAGFIDSGLHRTATELARKDALREDLVGGAVDFETDRARFGAVGYHARFEDPLRPSAAAYRAFDFAGTAADMLSAYGSLTLGDYAFFGEIARDPDGTIGGLGGLTLRVRARLEALVLARLYPRDFVSLHGYAFGERNGATQNETGFYTGLKLRLHRRWWLSGYFDQYRFPWSRFGVPRATDGHDALVRLTFRPHRWLSLYMQGRTETREEAFDYRFGRRLLEGVRPETRSTLRLEASYLFNDDLRLRARGELARHSAPGDPASYGLLLFHDARWDARPWLRLHGRILFFDVDSFDARLYAYEDDLLYAFAVPVFSGTGQRLYVLTRFRLRDALDLQIKYAATVFEDVQTVGSGLDETPGNRVRELRVQLRWRLR